jgi:hypothetical protein
MSDIPSRIFQHGGGHRSGMLSAWYGWVGTKACPMGACPGTLNPRHMQHSNIFSIAKTQPYTVHLGPNTLKSICLARRKQPMSGTVSVFKNSF